MHVRVLHGTHPDFIKQLLSGWAQRRPADTFTVHHLGGNNLDGQKLGYLRRTYPQNTLLWEQDSPCRQDEHAEGSSFALGEYLLDTWESPVPRPSESLTLVLGPSLLYDGGVGLLRALLGQKQPPDSSMCVLSHGTLHTLVSEVRQNRRIMGYLKKLHLAITSPVELFGPEQAAWVFAQKHAQQGQRGDFSKTFEAALETEKVLRRQYENLAKHWARGSGVNGSYLPVQLAGISLNFSPSIEELPNGLPGVFSGGAGGGVSAVLQLLGVRAHSLVMTSARWARVPPAYGDHNTVDRQDSWQNTDLVLLVDDVFSQMESPFDISAQALQWVSQARIVSPVIGLYNESFLSRRQSAASGMAAIYERRNNPERDWHTWGKKLANTWSMP